MGCPHTFEYRRSELKELGIIVEEDSEIVQGDKVAKSYLGMTRYVLITSHIDHCITYFRCIAPGWRTIRVLTVRYNSVAAWQLFVCTWWISFSHTGVR